MDDDELTALEAATLLEMDVQTLRSRLRRERPEGARQVPPKHGGNWFLRRSYVGQLAAENGSQELGHLPIPIVNKCLTPTEEKDALTLRGKAQQAAVVHGVWSLWFDFAHAMDHIPSFPGVYMLRPVDKPNTAPVYVGMAGLRKGKGLRGRLAVYSSGKGAVSGLGEHAFDIALADSWG
ncbi:hypothetical protein ACFUCV_14420 [Specibacter sp. NPDC057265]|uniref:hypothetical protein n=1 Tax=Specibacter sp. NPDC057265 TaxID=3346075 RepID=UPI0036254B3B